MRRSDAPETTGATAADSEAAASPERKRSWIRRLIDVTPSEVIVVLFVSIVVGMLLGLFEITPTALWRDFFETMARAWERFVDIIVESARWAGQYLLLGAVLVVPVWIVWRVVRALGERR